jgi:hypothetical protein
MMSPAIPGHRPRDLILSLSLIALTCLPVSAALSCSAANNGFTNAGGADAASSSGGMGQGGGGDIDPSGASGAQNSAGGGCATASVEAALVPLNMFIAVDKSGSMNENDKWINAKAAFTQFFREPAAARLNVALRFWPDNVGDCGDTGDSSCAGAVYACQQPDVNIGPLSSAAHQKALIDAFNARYPGGITPMSPALKGATRWCENYVKEKQKTEEAVVLLVTDGEPDACEKDPVHIAGIAEEAFQSAGVLTFTVGLAGSKQSTLDTIASGGHTGRAFMIGGGDTTADLLAALDEIRRSALACSFKLPEVPAGQTLDPTLVNVELSPGGGGPGPIGQVGLASDCGGTGGWYYDVPEKPTSINLCPSTCAAIQADSGAKLRVILGCSTHPA